jgi:hypothetical protein
LCKDCGLLPGPTLLAKLLFEAFREEADGARDETDDVYDAFRACVNDVPAPTSDVPLTVGRAPAVVGLMTSPPRSARVFLFGSGSLTNRIEAED